MGADTVAPGRDGLLQPAGIVHLVDEWQPLCGADAVRFVFPGRGAHAGADCRKCAAAVATPRQSRSRRAS